MNTFRSDSTINIHDIINYLNQTNYINQPLKKKQIDIWENKYIDVEKYNNESTGQNGFEYIRVTLKRTLHSNKHVHFDWGYYNQYKQ